MSNPITEIEIESIIKNFKANITEYEIIDMEKFKGWSSEYLFLLVSSEDNFILKAKTKEQITGYDNEVKVSYALLENNVLTRLPILTKNSEIFLEQYGYYWCLMTYIPGAQSHVNEYNIDTVKSLAEHIDQYVVASTTVPKLMKLDIKPLNNQTGPEILDTFYNEKNYFEKENIIKISEIYNLHISLKEGYDKYLKDFKVTSLIHNDINPRNILMDHTSKNVISLIDWDHVQFGNPLKDVSDAIAIFYDNLPIEKAFEFRKIFYESIKSDWFVSTDTKAIEYSFLYYFTLAKWRAILFYLKLLRTYGNKYGEKERFINEIKQNYKNWLTVVTSKYV